MVIKTKATNASIALMQARKIKPKNHCRPFLHLRVSWNIFSCRRIKRTTESSGIRMHIPKNMPSNMSRLSQTCSKRKTPIAALLLTSTTVHLSKVVAFGFSSGGSEMLFRSLSQFCHSIQKLKHTYPKIQSRTGKGKMFV